MTAVILSDHSAHLKNSSVCGRPIISYAADKAAAAGVDAIACDARFSGEKAEFRSMLPEDCRLIGIGEAIDKAFEKDEPVLLLFADIFSDINIDDLLKYHLDSCAEITLTSVSENESGIIGDIEKMPHAGDNGIFGGAAVISSGAAAALREFLLTEADAERFISNLRELGLNINIYLTNCFLAYIDSPSSLISVQKAVIYGRYIPDRPFGKNSFCPDRAENGEIICDPPVYIGKNCVISDGAVITAGSSVGDCVFIGRNARIEGGAVMNGAYIGENVKVNGSVISENARLLCGSAVMSGAYVGRNSCIGENTVVSEGVSVWENISVAGESSVTEDIIYGKKGNGMIFDSEGRMCGETNGSLSPSEASEMGSAAAGIYERICVGHKGNNASEALASAFAAGTAAAGGTAVMVGDVSLPELLYSVRISGCGCGCYIDSGITTAVRLCAADGLPMDEQERRYIEKAYADGEYRRVGYSHFGSINRYSDIHKLYSSHLGNIPVSPACGISVQLTCSDENIYRICTELLLERGYRKRGTDDKNGIVFHISSDGMNISAYSAETGYIFYDRLIMLCIIYRMKYENGETAVSSKIPAAADKIAAGFGKKLYRYSAYPDRRRMSVQVMNRERSARKAAAATPFAEDACAVMFTVLEYLTKEGISLKEAAAQLPEFVKTGRYIPMRGEASDVFKRICSAGSGGEGILSASENDDKGIVTVRPVRTGSGIMMYVESYAAETASELCDFYEDLIIKKCSEISSDG